MIQLILNMAGCQETNLVNFKKTNRALPLCVKYDILHSHFVRNFHMVAYRQGGLGPFGGTCPPLAFKDTFLKWPKSGENIFMSGYTPSSCKTQRV